jgi:hypothetical protein
MKDADSSLGRGAKSPASRPALRPTQLPGTLSTEVKLLGRESDHSHPPGVEIKNVGAIPPFLTRLHGVVLN